MIDRLANPSKPKSESHKLFVAGFPSGTSPQIVLQFFKRIDYSISLSVDEYGEHATRMAQKGCFIMNCPDPGVARGLVLNRYLSFYGRTLTVMPHKSGVELIIQNKKLKKRRVILKRVPWFVEENYLTRLLESCFGPLQLFFQLRHDNMNKKQVSAAKFTKYKSYSAYFINLQDAKKLAAQGTIALEDGSVITVHRYSEEKSSILQLEGNPPENSGHYKSAYIADQREIGLFQELNKLRPIPNRSSAGDINKTAISAFHHKLKPTQKDYFCVSEFGKARTFYELGKATSRYRFNKQKRPYIN